MNEYDDFLASKRRAAVPVGFSVRPEDVHPALFDFQRAIVPWALARGRAAVFAGTGLGKTLMQLEWARTVAAHTGGNVLVLAPLAVAQQTVAEGAKIGLDVTLCRDASDVRPGVNVANYERLHLFDPEVFAGVVLDESSILKAHDGKTRTTLIESFAQTRFRLACTATPAPNDTMELANHAEFLGVMTRAEMLATFFVHDGGETQKWRLKGHAESEFWRWMASWAVALRSPSDLGFDGSRFILPSLRMHQHIVEATDVPDGMLFATEAQSLGDRQRARRTSIADRVERCAAIVAREPDEPWIIWCDLNAESQGLAAAIPGAVEVTGSDSPETKERRMLDFSAGRIGALVSKPSICGFGMNWQHCARLAFVGLSDSWESYYQAIRRCWRFGQTRPVEGHVIASSSEGAVLANIERKERDAATMQAAMVSQMQLYSGVSARVLGPHVEQHDHRYTLPSWLERSA